MAKRSRKNTPPPAKNTELSELLASWHIALDHDLVITALTHRSFAFEAGGIETNERLEFLGDSVLSIIVSEYLYRAYPMASEADLSRMRASVVSQQSLAEVARTIHLGDFILLGKGENLTGGRERDSILCDTVEAMIGATFLSYGLEPTRRVVEDHLRMFLRDVVARGARMDYKTTLQEYCAQMGLGEPVYDAWGSGPDHMREYEANVTIGGVEVARGVASSKKKAKSEAARRAYLELTAADTSDGATVANTGMTVEERIGDLSERHA